MMTATCPLASSVSATPYIGRFAPTPSGPLHAGSIVAALASWLDARAHRGQWLLRIEDIDPPRLQEGAHALIVQTLQQLGLHWDGPVSVQSQHSTRFEAALAQLMATHHAYPCACTRSEIAAVLAQRGLTHTPDTERVYPGTCRAGLAPGRPARAWRLRVPPGRSCFHDRRAGPCSEDVAATVGDFVLRRADGLWAYQLAVVVDDAAFGVTDVVRGADLLASTARQRVLAQALGSAAPRTLHVPIVLGPDGAKLSKQHGAPAVDPSQPLVALSAALRHLEIEPPPHIEHAAWLAEATRRWAQRYGVR